MKARLLVMAAASTVLAGSFAALAQQDVGGAPVVKGGTVVVNAPKFEGYITEQDAALVKAAKTAIDNDTMTKSAMVSLIANNGELTVIGSTTDTAQSSRVVMKLKKVPGTTKVYAFLDPMTGDSQ